MGQNTTKQRLVKTADTIKEEKYNREITTFLCEGEQISRPRLERMIRLQHELIVVFDDIPKHRSGALSKERVLRFEKGYAGRGKKPRHLVEI